MRRARECVKVRESLLQMPEPLFKQLAETILRSFTLADPTVCSLFFKIPPNLDSNSNDSDVQVKCSAMQCLQRTLERQPCDAALKAPTCRLLVESLRYLPGLGANHYPLHVLLTNQHLLPEAWLRPPPTSQSSRTGCRRSRRRRSALFDFF